MTDGQKNALARLGEHFQDYLLLVRRDGSELTWRTSDPTWAVGAAQEYNEHVKHAQALERQRQFFEGGN